MVARLQQKVEVNAAHVALDKAADALFYRAGGKCLALAVVRIAHALEELADSRKHAVKAYTARAIAEAAQAYADLED